MKERLCFPNEVPRQVNKLFFTDCVYSPGGFLFFFKLVDEQGYIFFSVMVQTCFFYSLSSALLAVPCKNINSP